MFLPRRFPRPALQLWAASGMEEVLIMIMPMSLDLGKEGIKFRKLRNWRWIHLHRNT